MARQSQFWFEVGLLVNGHGDRRRGGGGWRVEGWLRKEKITGDGEYRTSHLSTNRQYQYDDVITSIITIKHGCLFISINFYQAKS